MSEIVKVDGAWRIAKSQQAEFVQNFLIPHLKKQVEDNNLTGKTLSQARRGFGKIFIGDEEKQISNVTKFLTSGKGLTLTDKGLRKDLKDRLLFKLRERMFEIEKMQNRLDEPFQSEWEQIFAAVIRIEEGK